MKIRDEHGAFDPLWFYVFATVALLLLLLVAFGVVEPA